MTDVAVGSGEFGSIIDGVLDLSDPPDWQSDALCLEYPRLDWFSVTPNGIREAKAICAECLVRAECLSYALDHPDLIGIWGGVTAHERKLRRGKSQTPSYATA
jgi:WhiB family redox-sensing transcriptional regulator